MAYENCINEIVAAGKGQVDRQEAEAMLDRVLARALKAERVDGLSRADASVAAAKQLGQEARIAAAYQRRDAAINALVRDALDARVVTGREAEAVRGLLGGVEGRGRNLANSIDAEAHAQSGRLLGGLVSDLRDAGLIKTVIKRSKAFEKDIARELWRLEDPAAGQPTGNQFAEQVAKIINKAQETARAMQNEAGARIGKLDHYVTRQSHDMEKIRGKGGEAARDEWIDFIKSRLDESTFENVKDRAEVIRQAYANLATGDHQTGAGAGASGFLGSQNLGKKLSSERKLHFKSADDWLEYNDRYGRGNVLDSVIEGLDSAGRNTAIMRHLGTNPQFMFDAWKDSLMKTAKARLDTKTTDFLKSNTPQKIFDVVTGKSELPANMTVAQVGRWIRQAQSVAKLGGVVLSSLPDLAVNVASLRHNGIPLLESYMQTMMAPLRGRRSGEVREIADAVGIGIDGMKGRLLSRFANEDRMGTSGKMVEMFHRLNGLSFWTDSLKTGVGLMLSNNLARNAEQEFASLPRRLQTTLRRYGIEAPEWDAMRKSELRAADGRDYMMPGNMQDLPDDAVAHLATTERPTERELNRIRDDLQAKLGTYIMDTSREAMTEPTAADRVITAAGTPGTIAGEAIKMMMQFKSYPATFLRRSIGRELKRDGVDVAGLAHLIVATTILGYASMTLKELAKGRNPRDISEQPFKTTMAAMVQGGGLGIYGDFLFGDANRLGGGFIGSLAGPTAGTIEDAHKLYTAIRDGSTTKSRGQIAAAEGLQVLKNNAPFLNLFYTRAALDYFVLSRLQEAINPGYLRRYEQKVKKENAQTFWLRPTSSPYR
jgi:hypothetical protein